MVQWVGMLTAAFVIMLFIALAFVMLWNIGWWLVDLFNWCYYFFQWLRHRAR